MPDCLWLVVGGQTFASCDTKERIVARLTSTDKQILEKLFQMGGGYVLNFSDRTFGEFFRDDMRIDKFEPKYNYASGSKANRLRGFWQIADDRFVCHQVSVLRCSRGIRNRADRHSRLTRTPETSGQVVRLFVVWTGR